MTAPLLTTVHVPLEISWDHLLAVRWVTFVPDTMTVRVPDTVYSADFGQLGQAVLSEATRFGRSLRGLKMAHSLPVSSLGFLILWLSIFYAYLCSRTGTIPDLLKYTGFYRIFTRASKLASRCMLIRIVTRCCFEVS